MMSLKHMLLVIVVVIFLLNTSETAKSKKNKGTAKKGKGKNQAKNKEEAESEEPEVLAPYIPEPDRQFWAPGGYLWTWDEYLDSPMTNIDFQMLWKDLKVSLEEAKYAKFSPLYYDAMEKWLAHGLRVSYVVNTHDLTTMYMAHARTENGENIPPVLGNGCTLEECCDPLLSYDWASQVDPKDLVNFNKPSELEQLYDQFVGQWQRLSKTFSLEEAKAAICQETYILPTKHTVAAKIETLEQEYSGFLEDPGKSGRYLAKKNLKKVHSVTAGKLLLNLMDYICKGVTRI